MTGSPAPETLSAPERTLFEIREDMRALVSSGDQEQAHCDADDLLVEALRKLSSIIGGDPTLWPADVADLIESYDKIPKWYA